MREINPTDSELERIRKLPTAFGKDGLNHFSEERGSVMLDYWFELGQWWVEVLQTDTASTITPDRVLQAVARETESKPKAQITRELDEAISRLDTSMCLQATVDALTYLKSPHNYIGQDIYLVDDITEIARQAQFMRTGLTELDNLVKSATSKRVSKFRDEMKAQRAASTESGTEPKRHPNAGKGKTTNVTPKPKGELKSKADPLHRKCMLGLMYQQAVADQIPNAENMSGTALAAAIEKITGKPVKV